MIASGIAVGQWVELNRWYIMLHAFPVCTPIRKHTSYVIYESIVNWLRIQFMIACHAFQNSVFDSDEPSDRISIQYGLIQDDWMLSVICIQAP